jgi:hypothetical protein
MDVVELLNQNWPASYACPTRSKKMQHRLSTRLTKRWLRTIPSCLQSQHKKVFSLHHNWASASRMPLASEFRHPTSQSGPHIPVPASKFYIIPVLELPDVAHFGIPALK